MVRFTFTKQERLSSLKAIERLFKEGQSLAKYPVRLVWMESTVDETSEFPIQVMFSVSKKKFSRAVDRNRIKRLMRETYRLLKPDLYTSLPAKRHFHLAIIFTGTEIPTLPVIQKNLSSSLERWLKKFDAIRSDPTNERKQKE